jgi:hypothetical protein
LLGLCDVPSNRRLVRDRDKDPLQEYDECVKGKQREFRRRICWSYPISMNSLQASVDVHIPMKSRIIDLPSPGRCNA